MKNYFKMAIDALGGNVYEFRKSIMKKQLHRQIMTSTFVIGYSILALLFFKEAIYPLRGEKMTFTYYYLIGLSSVFLMLSFAILHLRGISEKNRVRASFIFNYFFGLGYIMWGIMEIDLSLRYSKDINLLSWLLVFVILTTVFYFPTLVFISYLIISFVCAFIVFWLIPEATISRNLQIIMIVVGVFLVIIGASRFRLAVSEYATKKRNQQLMTELERNNQQLKATNETQKAFSAAMNHELRTPLNGIIGMLQIMLLNPDINSEDRKNLEICMSSGKTLISIVNELLDYYKLESGHFDILPVEFDLHDVVENTMAIFKPAADEKELRLELTIPESTPCSLYADDFRIQQVITNIVSNAIKYTQQGFVKLDISIPENNLIIKVSDSGQGISDEQKKELFTPFKRLNEKTNKKIQGTGLGLSVVKMLVEEMDGKIDIESTVGKGSTFIIDIPVRILDRNNVWGNKKVTGELVVNTVDLSGKKALYIDDNQINLKVLQTLLKYNGIEADIESSPVKGIELLKTNRYDIVFLDHIMPEMDGPEVLAKIKEMDTPNNATPFVAFTGNAGGELEDYYMNLGFAGYLSKPIICDDLIALAGELLAS